MSPSPSPLETLWMAVAFAEAGETETAMQLRDRHPTRSAPDPAGERTPGHRVAVAEPVVVAPR